MRFLQQTALIIFSILVLIVTVLSSLVIFGWLDVNLFLEIQQRILTNGNTANVILVLNLIFAIVAVVCIFLDGDKKDNSKDGVLLENEKGNLLISRETLENIIKSVVNGFESVQVNATKITLDNDGLLKITVSISVSENVIIKDLSNNLQIKIKEAIKKSADLEAKSVNISVNGFLKQKTEV